MSNPDDVIGYYIVPVDGSDELWDGTIHHDLLSAEMSLATADNRDWYAEGEKARWRIVGLAPLTGLPVELPASSRSETGDNR